MKSSFPSAFNWIPPIFFSLTAFNHTFRLSSTEMLTKTIFLPCIFRSNSFKWGISIQQGPHHVAHTSMYTYFPLKSFNVTTFPFTSR